MTTKYKEVTINILHINLKVRSALSTINKNRNIMFMRYAHNILNRINCSQDIAYMSNANYLCFLGKEILVGFHIKNAIIGHWNNLQN